MKPSPAPAIRDRVQAWSCRRRVSPAADPAGGPRPLVSRARQSLAPPRRIVLWLVMCAFAFQLSLAAGQGVVVTAEATPAAGSGREPVRSLRVDLPGREGNEIQQSWPGIGCWFWTQREFEPDGYRGFIDQAVRYSPFGLLTTSIRAPVEVTDPAVHDQIQRAAAYAAERGVKLVMDLDVRLARRAFTERYPDELQEIVRLRECPMQAAGEVELLVQTQGGGDHYTFKAPAYDPVASRLLRAYSYRRVGATDGIDAASIEDVTSRCRVVQSDAKGVKVILLCRAEDAGRTLGVLAAHSVFTPDVFATHLIEFERGILRQYADVALAGACKDEWGFPGGMADARNLWYSDAMARAYARRRPGHELVRDLLLMSLGEQGREGERATAINHYMEMIWQRNAEVETAFYCATKQTFGAGAMSATHPTWFPSPNDKEVFKNGLDWWVCQRDLAQTDESTPFCVRTALAKKWNSPLWFNMYYDSDPKSYEQDIWRHVLGGGRMNFHPLYPGPWEGDPWALADSRVIQASTRIGLLNLISTAPVDCPVAVVFGHPSALNWSGPGFADAGLAVCDRLWEAGFYADLIPSSEIAAGHLKIGDDGRLRYGPQGYVAAVLYEPQFERPLVAEFFRRAGAAGKTAVFRVGGWTLDFEGRPVDDALLFPAHVVRSESTTVADQVLERLNASGIGPQTSGVRGTVAGFPASVMPKPSGECRLLDGTVIVASGEHDVMGDLIQRKLSVRGHSIDVDAVGVAAVRLDGEGRVEALAAGGLKRIHGAGVDVELAERADVALWRDGGGRWLGVLLGHEGPVPEPLARLTSEWQRQRLPARRGGRADRETQTAPPIDRQTLDTWSAPYRGWFYHPDPVIPSDLRIPGHEAFRNFDVPTVFQIPGRAGVWYMSVIGFDGHGYNSFVLESTNLVEWGRPRLAMGFGPAGEFDHGGCVIGAYLYDSYDIKAPRLLKRRDGRYWTLYGCYPRQGGYELRPGYEGVAVSDDGLTWRRAKDTPILAVQDPDCGAWEKDCIYQPWLVEEGGRFYDFYNAANGGTEQMGGAVSTDLMEWKRFAHNPVVRNRAGGYDADFCSDGKVFRDGDHWVMFYFGVGRGGAHIMVAFSRDLLHWTVHPEPLYKAGGHPGGLDAQYAHKISLVHNPANDTFHLFYCAVGKEGVPGNRGRCIGLLTSRPLPGSAGEPKGRTP